MTVLLAAHEIATCETDPDNCDHGPELAGTDPWATEVVCRTHDQEGNDQ